jgi:transcriptional regulator with GAF, ATPase, and Fis domain
LRERFLDTSERSAVLKGLHARPDAAQAPAASALPAEARRLLGLVRRLLDEGEERRVLELAIDEAVQLTGAERAYLVLARPRGSGALSSRGAVATEIVAARNVERLELEKSPTFRFSRSIVQRVIRTGEPVSTASALDDPTLDRSRSILDLGLRSILAVPIRGPRSVLGALYLDHRIERGRFGERELELALSLADIVGVTLEKTRLLEQSQRRAEASERAADAAQEEILERAREVERLAELLRQTREAPRDQGGVVGRSQKILHALDVARRVANSDLPVLVRGESGTGKELFARFVHRQSQRSEGPFVAINCGAVPETLLESELFGHKRGAFTGAVADHAGLFRLADGGTLFLDEIGEMPLRMQTRLLRVLQEREVRPVGGSETVKVDVRIVAATHRNLEDATRQGSFREDLYYRLLGARVVLPALRERREDVLEIAQAILDRLAEQRGRRLQLSRDAERALLRHEWPGNVRELEQALTRGALLAESDVITPRDLDLRPVETSRRGEHETLDRALIERALEASKGNRSSAARALGISRVTLHRWLKRYGITAP